MQLEFWGSRYDCMNDPFDFQFARNRILPYARKAANHLYLSTDKKREIKTVPFVVSFSKKEDDFLMWRLYNSKVSLKLDSNKIVQDNNCILNKCYYVDDSDSKILEAIGRLNKSDATSDNIYVFAELISTFIKHNSFKPEGEVRLASWDYYDENANKVIVSDCIDDKDLVSKEFFSRTNSLGNCILYKKFKVSGEALKGIIVHTYSEIEFEQIRNLISSLLIQNDFPKEICSKIIPTSAYPLRQQ